jgi:nitroimidazol reductase NimA-like FMN-containing flavoprotein (pyridoxamine 5'-phosphate oxidase superfamily)
LTNDDIARAILDAGIYVVLGTADADGVPWASPVWFAKEDYQELYWVSYPGARHSEHRRAAAGRPGRVRLDGPAGHPARRCI